ncbi:hypothetical protein CRU98_03895 [Arcobacter sp. CECT 8986]|nr:hypothetical protein CRU98_03895 [Arcobacter sp. CECT 8986]
MEFELQKLEKEQQKEIDSYLILLAGFVLLILGAILFFYLNNKRKDKLRAYEDNMEKYFRSKETEAKLQIANKILDTIAKGDLKPETEAKLIASLNGTNSTKSNNINNSIENQSEIKKIDVIEEKENKDNK